MEGEKKQGRKEDFRSGGTKGRMVGHERMERRVSQIAPGALESIEKGGIELS